MNKAIRAAAQANANAREVSLQGWDTANVVTLDVLNAAIASQGTTPPGFDLTEAPTSITGKWGPWQVTPGRDGSLVEILCPVASGTGDNGGVKTDLAGAVVKIEITLKTLDDATVTITDSTGTPPPNSIKSTPGVTTTLVANDQPSGQDPAVTVLMITPKSLRNPYQFLFEDWFNANIASFKHIFHAIMLSEQAAKADFQWLKPTSISYATASSTSGATNIFAALCQTDNDSIGNLAQQIDIAVIQNLPAGCNSVLAISGEKFVEHILKKGAQQVLQGSQLTDFDIVGNGLVLTNNKPLTWQKMTLNDGALVSPNIPTNNFRMRVVGDQIELEFTDLTFSHPLLVGNDLFTLSFTQYYSIKLGQNAAGEQVLVPDFPTVMVAGVAVPLIVDKCAITVTPDQSAQDFQKYMDIASMVLSILPFGAAVFKAGAWGLRTGSALAARISSAAKVASGTMDVAVDATEAASMVDMTTYGTDNLAAAAAFASNAPAGAGFATLVNRIALISGMWAGITTIAGSIAKLQHNGDLDISGSPSIGDFLANVLGASKWPGAKNWTLKEAELAQSLLLHGELK